MTRFRFLIMEDEKLHLRDRDGHVHRRLRFETTDPLTARIFSGTMLLSDHMRSRPEKDTGGSGGTTWRGINRCGNRYSSSFT